MFQRSSHRSRPRRWIAFTLVVVIAVGMLSRSVFGRVPLPKEVGDVLWAIMFYLLVLLIAPRIVPIKVAAVALAISFATEFLKLYHAPWIDALRRHRETGFLLGHTFYWHDLACYVAGACIAMIVDIAILKVQRTRG